MLAKKDRMAWAPDLEAQAAQGLQGTVLQLLIARMPSS